MSIVVLGMSGSGDAVACGDDLGAAVGVADLGATLPSVEHPASTATTRAAPDTATALAWAVVWGLIPGWTPHGCGGREDPS
ncbi:hypothetical protein BJ963_003431 [Leifsonia soli]|uniref:Uncharacterized protein n=1 Tax=Leifsonia soli TaxID=582665 RepID=A0A852T4Y2_9MICO|nr:hypothetical protein [Leifsonia soli]